MIWEMQQQTIGVFHQFMASLAEQSQDVVQMESESSSVVGSSINNSKKEENIDG